MLVLEGRSPVCHDGVVHPDQGRLLSLGVQELPPVRLAERDRGLLLSFKYPYVAWPRPRSLIGVHGWPPQSRALLVILVVRISPCPLMRQGAIR